ncbi:MAG: OmpH family outer membrane protein [Alphaproteobacteria bacterium]|nr:MAG: OmpH family outer membrane protein [Alphaproteobacteria bacterium]
MARGAGTGAGGRRGRRQLLAALGAVLAGGLLAGPAAAQYLTAVVVLDQDRLFSASRFGKRVIAELEAARKALRAENERLAAELEAEEKALVEKRKTLPPEDFQQLARAFDEKVQRVRREQAEKDRRLARKAEEERRRFLELAAPVILEIAQNRGAQVVLDRRSVLLASDAVDVTEEAIRLLDERIGDGSGQGGAAAPATEGGSAAGQ